MSCEDGDTVPWTLGLLDLPTELQMEIFLALFDRPSVYALRVTCRDLDNVYQRIATTVHIDQRERIVAPIRAYLEFLARLKLPKSALRYPPASGWPHIAPGNGFEMKTPFAVDVLRHIPYVHADHFTQDTTIAPRSTMIDYSEPGEGYNDGGEDLQLENMYMDETPPSARGHMLLLSRGLDSGGCLIFIDTLRGLIYQEDEEFGRSAPVIPVQDYFKGRTEMLMRFDEIFIPDGEVIYRREELDDRARAEMWNRGFKELRDHQEHFCDFPLYDVYDAKEREREGEYVGEEGEEFGQLEDGNWVRHLHFKHGWPGETWDKEACLEEIREYVDRRHLQRGPRYY